MLLPHIHREGLRHWHLQDRATRVRQEEKLLSLLSLRQLFAPEGPGIEGKIKDYRRALMFKALGAARLCSRPSKAGEPGSSKHFPCRSTRCVRAGLRVGSVKISSCCYTSKPKLFLRR